VRHSLLTGIPKNDDIALVCKTLKGMYDMPKDMDMHSLDSGKYMRLVHEWNQCKRLKAGRRTKIWWQNYMRSNTRKDSGVFTEQLTSY